jgi:hypothetical protein
MIHDRLAEIQQTLKAPKNQKNSFGNYNYRSCEDILEAVKPLLGAVYLTISDEIVLIGDRYYVKATATISDGKESISNSAYARESLEKKGMDASQVTGATSSYARKYALNGLFAIDDTKDADTMDNSKDTKPSTQTAPSTPKTASTSTEDQVCPIHKINVPKRFAKVTNKPYWICNGDPAKSHFLDDPNKMHEDVKSIFIN